MFYRVTQSQMSATARNYLSQQASELYNVQKQISSGVKIHRPADDPAAMRRSLIQKDRIERLEAHETSITHVKSRVQQAQVHLLDANTLLTKAREIALQAPQLTDDSERRILAAELNGLLEQMGSLANATDESGYLFSGTAANTRPFTITTSDSGATQYGGRSGYAGTSANTELHIAGDVDRQALLPGSLVFQPMAREATVLIGNTGASIGTGTDSATGTRTLIVSHTSTTFSAGSGVQSGASAANGNTVIGATGVNSLQIIDTSGTGASGTISLNGGDPVSFTSGMTDLLVTGPGGEKIYLNTSSITAGFNGTVNLTSTGTMSIDGGLTSTPITFDPNQQVTDSRDGTVVNLNTVAIRRAGSDQLEFPGTSDVFNVLRELRDDLLNTRNLETSALNASLNRRLGDVERVQDHVLDMIGVQSVSLEQIERLEERTGDLKLAEKLEYGDTIAADVTAAALRLQELNNLQQFTMAAVGQLLTPNLLSYIQ
jgi:flagellar hook-associated protein 3